jgi:hypothetical protein
VESLVLQLRGDAQDDSDISTAHTIDFDGDYFSVTESPTGAANVTADTRHIDAYNGTFIESFTFVVTSNGSTITGTLDKNPSGDLTQRFSDGYSTFSSGGTVSLTAAGGDDAPVKNYIYILQSGKTTLVANTAWPAAEHIKVAEVVVQTEATVQSDGPLANRNWNDHAKGTNAQGHHTHVWERLRWEHSAYLSGSAVTWSGSGTGALDLAITAGKTYQLHIQDVAAFDTSDPASVLVPNHKATPYTATVDIETLVLDSDGDSLAGKYYNLVVWLSVSSGSETERVFINLPGGSYNKQNDATADVAGYDNYAIPSDFRGYAYLVNRITLKHSAAGGGTWTNIAEVDLRGQIPNIVAGSGTAAITTEFADSQFRVFDDGDPTRELAFEVSGVAGSTTRTVTVPNEDTTLHNAQTLDEAYDQGGAGAGRQINVDTGLPLLLEAANSYEVLRAQILNDANPRWSFGITGGAPFINFGGGTDAVDITLYRRAANVLALLAGDSFEVNVINEINGGGAGVTIDGVLLKDGLVAVGDVAFDDGTSDPLIDGAAAADGTENSVARKDHVHPRHHVAPTHSVHQYVFAPDAAPAEDIATGALQGTIHVSGPSAETVKRITGHVETAAGTTVIVTLKYDANDDLDDESWTDIDTMTFGTVKSPARITGGFEQSSVPAQRLITLDVDTVTGTAPTDMTIILEVWRPLQTI